MKKLLSVKNVVISVAILILIWQLLFMVSSFDAALFPSPKMALDALIEMIQKASCLRISKQVCSALLRDI